ncbi:hypothetical protein LguiB_029159 [Lonicera macranthoides]
MAKAKKTTPYPTLTKDASSAPPISYFDYIIIGGGTSGCALAATLSQSTATVLLLERGDSPYTYPNVNHITGFAATLADTSPTSASQLFVSSDGVINHRARVLGGGSALNAGFFTRASEMYVGRVGWDQRLVNESYEWVERKVAYWPLMMTWQSAVRDGLIEAGVLPYNGFTTEHIYGTKVGGSIFDENGRRHTAADLLEYADVENIVVYLKSTVHRILFATRGQKRPKAHGVLFMDANGKKHIAYLKSGPQNEIILSAGALGSPQLLMLSGVGPAQHLRAHKIRVVMDQPMVGQGMSDNPMNAIVIPSPQPVEISLIQVVGITRSESYIEAASGSFDLDLVHKIALDLGLPLNLGDILSTVDLPLNSTLNAGIILEKIMGPLSTGHLELQTKDPNDNPKVTFNYFKEPQDLQRCVQGMETIIKVIESKSLTNFRYPLTPVKSLFDLMVALPLNLRPKHVTDTLSLEQFCMDTVITIWHYHGGCQVGKVVDHDYKVVGVDSLRVIDGSTFYDSPGTNPQATVMMLGRYMGQRILGERYEHGRK